MLTDTGYNIDDKFKQWFIGWAKDKRYVLATGSTLERTVEQIGNEIVDGALLVANCMGNSVYQDGKTTVLNEFEFLQEELDFLQEKIDNSKFQTKTGQHIVARPGSYNVSVVGRNANIEQREEYKNFDKVEREREQIAKEFQEQFPKFDVYIGGDISLDICLQGANKGQIFDLLVHQMLDDRLFFFGDKMGTWGIDRPLKERIQQTIQGKAYNITNGYQETKNILMYHPEPDDDDKTDSP